MKIFLAYRFTGEDPAELRETLEGISANLVGHEVYCSFFEEKLLKEENLANEKILNHALDKLEGCDTVLAFIKSDDKSEGMLLEIGYAIARRKKLILAIKEGVETNFLRELASQVIEFKNFKELLEKLKGLK